ncbi:MAG: peptidoglycan DD-metalloendopeptidase family protein [Thermodesulfobacteriota bacterium]|jgi:murein DD-endopeptidase MepM/ murein hydrolase activator NlpD
MVGELERGRFHRPSPNAGKKKRRRILFLGASSIGLFLLIYFFVFSSRPILFPAKPTRSIHETPREEHLQMIEGEVRERSTLFKSLSEQKIPLPWIHLVVSKLKPYVDFKKIKGGTYRFIKDVKGEMVKFVFEAGPTEIYEIEKDDQGYIAKRRQVSLETRLVKVEGEIHSSLFEAMDAAGEGDPLTIAFADILAWEVDFYKDVREGDRFKVLVEKVYKGEQFIQYGSIHAVEYQREERVYRGIRYEGDYYDENGNSMKKAFLKTPLRFNRISSRFSLARKHPIMGGVRPHLGVDYAAPIGTPIWAVADGTVVSSRWNGGFGNQVVLRHPNGYVTYYGHLSRYGHGIRKGVRVAQKQVIGYVGSTGLSTGPHLDYRLAKEGQLKNPLRVSFPEGVPIGKAEREAFLKRRDEMIAWLQGSTSC